MSEVEGEIELTEYGAKLLFEIMELTGESMEEALITALEQEISRLELEASNRGSEGTVARSS